MNNTNTIWGPNFVFTLYPWGKGRLLNTSPPLQERRKNLDMKIAFLTLEELFQLFLYEERPHRRNLETIVGEDILNSFINCREFRENIKKKIINIRRALQSNYAYIYDDKYREYYSMPDTDFKREVFIETLLSSVIRGTSEECEYCPPLREWDKLGYMEREAHTDHILHALESTTTPPLLEKHLKQPHIREEIAETCSAAARCCLTKVDEGEILKYLNSDLSLSMMLLKERLLTDRLAEPITENNAFTLALRDHLNNNKFTYLPLYTL